MGIHLSCMISRGISVWDTKEVVTEVAAISRGTCERDNLHPYMVVDPLEK